LARICATFCATEPQRIGQGYALRSSRSRVEIKRERLRGVSRAGAAPDTKGGFSPMAFSRKSIPSEVPAQAVVQSHVESNRELAEACGARQMRGQGRRQLATCKTWHGRR
jgi:hypothetical protein